eukprot:COSAG01_NODE_32830_length_574_cov_1.837895_1_plen_76_part_10
MSAGGGFTAGDAVTWTGSDDDVPAGTVGKVLGYNDAGKVRVQFPAGTWAFPEGKLRAAGKFATGDAVTWTGSDDDV